MRINTMTSLGSLAILAAFSALLPVPPALAQGGALAMLSQLESGAWDIRIRPENRKERICVRTGRELIQLRHQHQSCGQFVVEDTANRVTVQYTCKGHGYGRTQIRRESNGLVQIESQGLIGGQPFALSAEARRAGPCN